MLNRDPQRRQVITLRAILLGLVTVVLMQFLVNYQVHVVAGSVLNLSQLPAASLIAFMVWVIVNSVLRVAAPRWALSATEVLTIFAMSWAAGMLGGRAWTGRLLGMLCAPKYHASAENRWIETLGGLGKQGLLPTWLYPDVNTKAIDWFYATAPSGQPIPWSSWVSPLFWWCAAAVAFLSLAMAVTVIFYRQWAVHERLTFPLISAPMTLVEEARGRRLPPIFRKRLFWLGVLLSGGVLCWNIGGYFSTGWVHIPIFDTAAATRREPITGYPAVSFRIMPLVIGFLYFANLDLLLSLWLFFILGWIEAGISNTTGFAVGAGPIKVSGWNMVRLHSFGALVLLAVWSLWMARHHLRHVGRSALSRHRRADNPEGAMSYRTAILLFAWALAFLIFFCVRIGMSAGVIALALGFILIAFFTVAKYMAATGLSYINPPYTASGRLIMNMAGNAWMTPRSIIGLGMMHGGQFGQMQRLFGFGMMPHAFKVADQAKRGRSRIVTALILAVVVGSGFSLWHILHLGYTRGALRMESYTLSAAPNGDFGYLMDSVESVQNHRGLPADWEKFAAFGVGFVLAAGMMLMQTRFRWWPLHPVGLAFSMTSAGVYWLSIFIVWLAKLIIVKLGGAHLYERAKPFFVGLIVGYILALIISFSVDAIFFPGQPAHAIHNW